MKKNFFIRRSFSLLPALYIKSRCVVGLIVLLFTAEISFAQNPLVKQWDYRFGGTGIDDLFCFQQTKDSGYILGGYSTSGMSGDKTQPSWGGADYWIAKIDSLGVKQWDKRFGGTGNDELYYLQQTTDGGYILGGQSLSGISGDKTQLSWGGWDYWIVKIDSLGVKQWDKRFGGTGDDELYSLQQTADGGYILGGYTYPGISGDKSENLIGNNLPDFWILKIDSLGTKLWDKDFGWVFSDKLTSLKQTSDGGYILGGWSYPGIGSNLTDYWIIKIDSLGNEVWEKYFGGIGYEYLFSVEQTTDKGYILGGYSNSDISGDKTQPTWGGYDYWIVKTDSIGNMQWDKDFGGTDDEDEFGNISQTPDGGYLIAGTSYSNLNGDKTENNLGQEQSWIVKTDSLGNKLWDKTIFTYGHDEAGYAIQIKHGCYVIFNYTYSDTGGYKTQPDWNNSADYWIIKSCDTTSFIVLSSSDQSLCEKFCTNFFDQSINVNAIAWQWFFPGGTPSSSTDQNPTNICYNDPGVFDVTLITTNAFGNDTLTLSNYITVYSTPPFPTITQVGYTLTSSAADSYQWQFNSVNISGATNQSYTIMQTGFYTVMVSDSNGCVNSTTQYVLISGIADQVSDQNIFIEPNPSNGNFLLMMNNVMQGKFLIEIFNAIGQRIFSEEEILSSYSFSKEIHLTVSGGIYLVTVSAEEKTWRKKIVINEP